jgi:hypothetical protein
MKYLITESRLEEIIFKYLDNIFPVDNINWVHPYEYNDDTGEEYEDGDRIEFYHGDFSDEDTVFRWYNCDYFNEGSYARTICPTVDVESEYVGILNGYFGEKWIEPFEKWFTLNFKLPVKTVEWM